MAAEEAVGKSDYRVVYIYCRQGVRSMFAGLQQHFLMVRGTCSVRTCLLFAVSASPNEKGLGLVGVHSSITDRDIREGAVFCCAGMAVLKATNT